MLAASNFRRRTAAIAVVAMLLQPSLAQAVQHSDQQASAVPKQPAAKIADVALQQGGVLAGQLTDAKGAPLAGAVVVATGRAGRLRAMTNADGRFEITGLKGGLHRIDAAGQTAFCRTWTAGAQPPHAQTGLLLVAPGDIALGQHCGSRVGGGGYGRRSHPFRNPVIMGGVVAAAIAIPVALSNSDGDENPLASP